MIRKIFAVSVLAFAMAFAGFAGTTVEADANSYCNSYELAFDDVYEDLCADVELYPGPFTNHPPHPTGPYGWYGPNPVAAADAGGAGGGDAGGALAHTGSESTVIAYVGTGLIAFGAVALGTRRKFFQGALD